MLASLSGNMQQTMVMQMVQQVGRCGGIGGVFFCSRTLRGTK